MGAPHRIWETMDPLVYSVQVNGSRSLGESSHDTAHIAPDYETERYEEDYTRLPQNTTVLYEEHVVEQSSESHRNDERWIHPIDQQE